MRSGDPGGLDALRRLRRRLSAVWTCAWLAGVAIFAIVVWTLSADLRQLDLDSELALRATATYGLTWFDEDGFHDEDFLKEPDLVDATFDIWVIEPGGSPEIHLGPEAPRFELAELMDIAQTVVATDSERLLDGQDRSGAPFRAHAIPTYDWQDPNRARAAVIVVGDPVPGLRAQRWFLGGLLLVAALLGIVGIGLGIALARWTLRPVADSIEQREHFLSAAAHELRTPVAALRGVCESALAGDEPADEALGRMASIIDRSERLVENLLVLARLDGGARGHAKERVRVDLLVDAALPEDAPVKLVTTEAVLLCDPQLLSVAVRNLIENASTHGGGIESVVVAVASDRIVVEDDGPGFPNEVLEVATRPFSIAPSTRGFGLGLAIVRRIAELHGGSLLLENRTPRGARVTMTFPRREFS